jgi:hypothetical protein
LKKDRERWRRRNNDSLRTKESVNSNSKNVSARNSNRSDKLNKPERKLSLRLKRSANVINRGKQDSLRNKSKRSLKRKDNRKKG